MNERFPMISSAVEHAGANIATGGVEALAKVPVDVWKFLAILWIAKMAVGRLFKKQNQQKS